MKIPRKFHPAGLVTAQILPPMHSKSFRNSVGLPQVALPSIYHQFLWKGGYQQQLLHYLHITWLHFHLQILQNQQILVGNR